MASKSFIIYEGDFCLRLEYDEDYAIIHFPWCKKWSPSVFKSFGIKIYETLEFVKDMGYNVLYAGVPRGDIKMEKLSLILGFEKEGETKDYLVYRLE